MDGLGKPLQLDGLFVGSSHSTPCFIRQQYLRVVLPNKHWSFIKEVYCVVLQTFQPVEKEEKFDLIVFACKDLSVKNKLIVD